MTEGKVILVDLVKMRADLIEAHRNKDIETVNKLFDQFLKVNIDDIYCSPAGCYRDIEKLFKKNKRFIKRA